MPYLEAHGTDGSKPIESHVRFSHISLGPLKAIYLGNLPRIWKSSLSHAHPQARPAEKGYYTMSGTSSKNSKIQKFKRKILV